MLKLCKKYQVDRNWFSKQALKRKKAEATGGDDMFDFLKRTAGSGRPRKWEKFEIKEVLFVWARAQDYDFTYDEAEAQLGIPKSTFNAMIKLTWATKIRMQQDNAPPHTGKDMVGRLNLFGKAMTIPIEVEPQPSNSPETNTLDLSVFNSWCRRNHKLQKYAKHKGKEALMDNLEKSWAEYPAEILERAFKSSSIRVATIFGCRTSRRRRERNVAQVCCCSEALL
jgi:hypothetical protein